MTMHPSGRLTKFATLLLLASVAAVPTGASPLGQLEDGESLFGLLKSSFHMPAPQIYHNGVSTATLS